MYKFISIIEQLVDKKIDFLLNGINGTKMNNKNKAMFKFIPITDQSMDKKIDFLLNGIEGTKMTYQAIWLQM